MRPSAADTWSSVVAGALAKARGRPVFVRKMLRLPIQASSSHRIEELHLLTEGGQRIELVAKETGPGGMSPQAASVKPAHLLDAERETLIYLQALNSAQLGTAPCHGAWVEPETGRKWLLLEKIEGTELFQWGDLEVWKEASRWLARLHTRFSRAGADFPVRNRLLRLDRDHLLNRMAAACSAVVSNPAVEPYKKAAFLHIRDRYCGWVELSLRCAPTLLHGDFHPANILVAGPAETPRICPVDWEMAGWGPGLSDLAALLSGDWSNQERLALIEAYQEGWEQAGAAVPESFEAVLQAWRLQHALQWIGWSPDWSPPTEQRRDWISEALAIAG